MVDELYSAVHSASSNPLKVETLMENLGKQFYDEGSIAQAYKPAFFARGTSNENPAVYALSSRLAMLDNNTQFADDLVARMKTMQISDSASENYGAFLGTENDAIYSTWQLHCLIALAEKREQ
jgi:hypothetical protein